jgi:hypothetical protein
LRKTRVRVPAGGAATMGPRHIFGQEVIRMTTRVPFADPTTESDKTRPDGLQSASSKPMLVDGSRRREDVTAAQDRNVDMPTPVKGFPKCG